MYDLKSKKFEKPVETFKLSEILSKYPLDTVLTEIKTIFENLTNDSLKDGNYKLANLYKKNKEEIRNLLEKEED